MKTNRIVGSMAVLALGMVLFAQQSLAAAFGVSPPWVTNDNLKPDSHFVYVIDLSTNDPREDMVVTSKVTGDPEIQKWVTIKDATNLVMPMGQQHTSMYVEVNVPKDAEVGKYEGNIALTVSPRQLNPNQISILLGGNIAVNLKVIDHDVVDYWIRSIATSPIVEGQAITLEVEAKNLGNVPLNSIETKTRILDFKTGQVVATSSEGRLNKVIYPQTTETAMIELPIQNLSAGQYWLKVDAIKSGRTVYQNKILLDVNAPSANGILTTSVSVPGAGGDAMRGSAPEQQPVVVRPASSGNTIVPTTVRVGEPAVSVATSVTVRAPLTNQLIMVVIGLLLVVVGIAYRIYTTMRKGGHHHR